MALTAPPVGDRKRVKVYELKNNDWFDRGTGFCTGTLVNVSDLLAGALGDGCAWRCRCLLAVALAAFSIALTVFNRMKQGYMCSQRMSPSGCC
jgi:hypothetical protein